jgi:hypothetical protein
MMSSPEDAQGYRAKFGRTPVCGDRVAAIGPGLPEGVEGQRLTVVGQHSPKRWLCQSEEGRQFTLTLAQMELRWPFPETN